MKRFAAILFLSILLFNLYGYRVFFDYLLSRNELSSMAFDSNKVNEKELVSIKMGVSLPPYASNSKAFEWVDGEITVEGVIYQYVKRRIFSDSIEYLCIPNFTKMQYQNARNDFFKLSNDLGNIPSKKSTGNLLIKPSYFEYFSAFEIASLLPPKKEKEKFYGLDVCFMPERFLSSLDHPPQPTIG